MANACLLCLVLGWEEGGEQKEGNKQHKQCCCSGCLAGCSRKKGEGKKKELMSGTNDVEDISYVFTY